MNVTLICVVVIWKVDDGWSRNLTRILMLIDALVDTGAFAIVLLIAIRKKRLYKLDTGGSTRPENLLVAIYAFLACSLYYALMQFAQEHAINSAPLLLAITPCIAAYCCCLYIDRALARAPLSWSLICWQAIFQGLATALAMFFASQDLDAIVYSGCEALVIGLLIGYLFQRFYQRSEFTSAATLADVAYRPISLLQART